MHTCIPSHLIQKILAFISLMGECRQQNTPRCIIHKDRMWLPQWLDQKTITYAKISPKMVKPRDIAGECRRRRRNQTSTGIIVLTLSRVFLRNRAMHICAFLQQKCHCETKFDGSCFFFCLRHLVSGLHLSNIPFISTHDDHFVM